MKNIETASGNEKNRQRDCRGVVTRRDFLKASGCAVAGFSVGVSFAGEQENAPEPLLRFGMVTDPHYADTEDRGTRNYRESAVKMAACVAAMNEHKVDFLIELGDFKDQGDPVDEARTLTFLETIESVFVEFKGPRYHVLGNHDVDSISKAQFQARVENSGIAKDATYYSFDTKGVHFVVLDACYQADGSDYDHGNFQWHDCNIAAAQLAWLEKDLAATPLPVIVFSHQLLDSDDSLSIRNAARVRQILNTFPNVLAAFHGHNHAGRYAQLDGIHYYTLRSVVEGSGQDNNSYAIVEVHPNHNITVTGYQKAVSMALEKA